MKQGSNCVLGAARNAEIRYTPSDIIQEIQNGVFKERSAEIKLGIIL